MHKYQQRKNKLKPYACLLSKNQMNTLTYNDNAYKDFMEIMRLGKEFIERSIYNGNSKS